MSVVVGDLFAGGGGSSIGAMAAGGTVAWAIELNHDAADCYERNLGEHVIRQPLQDVDPRTLHPIDVLLASPPCPAFSAARSKKLAARDDGWLGLAVIPYIETLLPRVFILENVPPYLTAGWPILSQIVGVLWRLGYTVDWSIVNAADHGVAQTRSRLFVRAVRGALLPALPAPVPWVGWYTAIEDLIPGLPESKLAPWQVERLSRHPVYGSFLVDCTTAPAPNGERGLTTRRLSVPAVTVKAGTDKRPIRAVLVDSKNPNQEWGKRYRDSDEPCFTVVSDGKGSHAPRAVLLSNSATLWGDGLREDAEPAHTISTQSDGRTRALLISTQSSGRPEGELSGIVAREGTSPSVTIAPNAGRMRALLIHPTEMRNETYREAGRPSFTVGCTHGMPRVLLNEPRVVSLNIRALARLQSFPDWYQFPDSRTIAARIVGNAVPCLVEERLLRDLLADQLEETA